MDYLLSKESEGTHSRVYPRVRAIGAKTPSPEDICAQAFLSVCVRLIVSLLEERRFLR
jgi:hypothetical protein